MCCYGTWTEDHYLLFGLSVVLDLFCLCHIQLNSVVKSSLVQNESYKKAAHTARCSALWWELEDVGNDFARDDVIFDFDVQNIVKQWKE